MKTLITLTVAVPSVIGFLAYIYNTVVAPVIAQATSILK